MTMASDDTISVRLQLHPLLRPYVSCPGGAPQDALSVRAGTTVATMLRDICGLPAEIQVFVAVNGRSSPLSRRLDDGDTVSVFMAVGGG